jgi:hypothetical protein
MLSILQQVDWLQAMKTHHLGAQKWNPSNRRASPKFQAELLHYFLHHNYTPVEIRGPEYGPDNICADLVTHILNRTVAVEV